MISRYSRKEMADIWSEEAQYSVWAKVERTHLMCLVNSWIIPCEALSEFDIAYKQSSVNDYRHKEKEVKHDVIAFVEVLAARMPKFGNYLHLGITSSDIVDTSTALRVKKSLGLLRSGLSDLVHAVRERMSEHKDTKMMGRTHGIHAEPITFAKMLSNHHEELVRAFSTVVHLAIPGKMSGAVGNYNYITKTQEKWILTELGLEVEKESSQIVNRDHFARLGDSIKYIALAIERLCTNIRHLSRTEVYEVSERFDQGQKGSSIMPHKKNPITAENLCGLARVVTGYANMLTANTNLWHERDISHSSVERIVLPDMLILIDCMIHKCRELVKGLVINASKMEENISITNDAYLAQVMLIDLLSKGMSRSEAYSKVQALAFKDTHLPFQQRK